MTVETVIYPMWQSLVSELAVPQNLADEAWVDVKRRYGENGRFYHTFSHIHHALQVAELIREQFEGETAVQLAIWFHDVIYNPRTTDNEEQSAKYAQHQLQTWQLSPELIDRVTQLILATKTHHTQSMQDTDMIAFLDVDLAILGSDAPQYVAYAQAIRKEYAFVPEHTYRQARQQVLTNFLDRTNIFHTPKLQMRFEAAARMNIKRELLTL